MRCKDFKFKECCKSIPSTTYLTHGIHSYTAKFIPHIPHHFIKKYTKPGDIVLDPFCGSGTTLVEAKINGVNSFGIDLNPLAQLITKVKTTPLNPKEVDETILKLKKLLKTRLKLAYDVNFPNKFYWFHKKTVRDLRKIMSAIKFLEWNGEVNKNMENFLLISFSSIIRISSYADSRNPKTYCSPRMRRLREANIPKYPIPYFLNALEKNSIRIKQFYNRINKLKRKPFSILVSTNDATNIRLPKGKNPVDIIITSPPYANAQEYFRNIKLELFWLGLADKKKINKLDKRQIGGENHAARNYMKLQETNYKEINQIIKKIYTKNKKSSYIVYKYFTNMKKVLQQCHKVLKKDKHMIIIMGNNTVRGVHIPIHKILIKLAINNGFRLHELGYDKIKSRSFMTKRNNTAPIIKKDWVIDLVKK